jgi:type III secretory pathway component EscU
MLVHTKPTIGDNMKFRLAPVNPANHLHRPFSLGSAFRGYEPLLRIGQLILLVWLALAGAKVLAQALVHGAGMLLS